MSHGMRRPRQGQIDESREWIAEALVTLLGERRAHERITLSEIAARAGVSRQTVYRHFADQAEILDWYFEKRFTVLMTQITRDGVIAHRENLRLAFEFCREHSTFLRALVSQGRERLLLTKLEEFSRRLTDLITRAEDPVKRFYHAKLFSGALFMAIVGWLERDEVDSPESLAELLEQSLPE